MPSTTSRQRPYSFPEPLTITIPQSRSKTRPILLQQDPSEQKSKSRTTQRKHRSYQPTTDTSSNTTKKTKPTPLFCSSPTFRAPDALIPARYPTTPESASPSENETSYFSSPSPDSSPESTYNHSYNQISTITPSSPSPSPFPSPLKRQSRARPRERRLHKKSQRKSSVTIQVASAHLAYTEDQGIVSAEYWLDQYQGKNQDSYLDQSRDYDLISPLSQPQPRVEPKRQTRSYRKSHSRSHTHAKSHSHSHSHTEQQTSRSHRQKYEYEHEHEQVYQQEEYLPGYATDQRYEYLREEAQEEDCSRSRQQYYYTNLAARSTSSQSSTTAVVSTEHEHQHRHQKIATYIPSRSHTHSPHHQTTYIPSHYSPTPSSSHNPPPNTPSSLSSLKSQQPGSQPPSNPTPSHQPSPPNPLEIQNQHLLTRLLRSRRYGDIAEHAHATEQKRQNLLTQISVLNDELEALSYQERDLVAELVDYGVDEGRLPSYLAETLHWRTYLPPTGGYFGGWEQYWEKRITAEWYGVPIEALADTGKKVGVWKRWGRKMFGRFWGGPDAWKVDAGKGEAGKGSEGDAEGEWIGEKDWSWGGGSEGEVNEKEGK
ncbi:hypothetical protein ACMFMF_008759 [Clarireedia jacksonii]